MRRYPYAIVAALLLAGCAAPPPKPVAAPPPPPPLDPSYDWHVLLTQPFGTVLKDVPFTLHEVLLFKEDEHGAAAADEAECYAVDATPKFLTRAPEHYLLCFKHDRLARVEATVRLPQDQAAKTYADACGLWMRNAHASSTEGCTALDGTMTFSGSVSDVDQADSVITVELEAPDHGSDRP